MRIIKDKKISEDDWNIVRDLDDAATIPEGNVILPISYWQSNRDELLKQDSTHAVWIDGDVETEEVSGDLEHFSIIGLDFPAFKDGRSYTHARMLRDRYGFKGELRAIGNVLRDQMFFMMRCGIDCFEVSEGKDAEEALKSFNDFSVRYQAAADDAVPIYKLR
tara:strand:- start:5035 stop:5523 length:489 start_codon:yes stop_codon:yes gene_type:complete